MFSDVRLPTQTSLLSAICYYQLFWCISLALSSIQHTQKTVSKPWRYLLHNISMIQIFMSIYIKITLGWYLLTSYPDYCNIIFSVVSDSSLMLTSRISPQIIHHLLISGKLSPTSDQFEVLSFLTYSYFTVYVFLI